MTQSAVADRFAPTATRAGDRWLCETVRDKECATRWIGHARAAALKLWPPAIHPNVVASFDALLAELDRFPAGALFDSLPAGPIIEWIDAVRAAVKLAEDEDFRTGLSLLAECVTETVSEAVRQGTSSMRGMLVEPGCGPMFDIPRMVAPFARVGDLVREQRVHAGKKQMVLLAIFVVRWAAEDAAAQPPKTP